MNPSPEPFSLAVMFGQLKEAFVNVVLRVGFEAALHGLIAAGIVFTVAVILLAKGHRYGKPLLAVFRKVSLFCLVFGAPGAICLLSSGTLPPVNALQLSSVGLLGFWCLVILHLCMEEMNFQWFTGPDDFDEEQSPDARSAEDAVKTT